MIGEAARKRRAERNERVAEVRALGIKVGDWIVTGTYGRIIRATPDALDARADMFQYLRRATPKEIAVQEAKEAEQKRQHAKRAAYENRPDVRNAGYILCQDTADLLKLGPKYLAQIVRRLMAAKNSGA